MALPLIAAAYVGIAEAAAEPSPVSDRKKSPTDPILPILMGEMENQLAIAQVDAPERGGKRQRLGL